MPILAFCGLKKKKKYQQNLRNHFQMKEFGSTSITFLLIWIDPCEEGNPMLQFIWPEFHVYPYISMQAGHGRAKGQLPIKESFAEQTTHLTTSTWWPVYFSWNSPLLWLRPGHPPQVFPYLSVNFSSISFHGSLLPLPFQRWVLNWAPSFPFCSLFK